MIDKYDVLVEIDHNPKNWKHIEVFASSRIKAGMYAEEEFRKDGADVVDVVKITRINNRHT